MNSPDPKPDTTQSTSNNDEQPAGSRRRIIGGSILFAIGLLAVIGSVLGGSDADDEVQADSVYDFVFSNAASETVTLASYEGQPLVLNYFAAWCGPCRRELPDFEAVHQAIGDEVNIVGINRDNTTGSWLGLVDSTGLTFDTYFEGNLSNASFTFVEGLAMPTTAFVSKQGEVVHTVSGALTEERLLDLIDEHLLTN